MKLHGKAAPVVCWIALILASLFVGWKALGGLPIDTDIQSVLPDAGGGIVERAAIKKANIAGAGRVAILIRSKQAEDLRSAAADLESALSKNGFFISDQKDGVDTFRWVFANRDELLCEKSAAQFDDKAAHAIAQRALVELYTPTGIVTGDLLRADPFLRTTLLARCLMPDMLHSERDGVRLVSGRLRDPPFALRTQADIDSRLKAWAQRWGSRGVSYARTGAVFYAKAGADQAKREVSLVGGFGSVGVIFLFFLAFRRVRAVVASMILVGVGMVVGLAAVLAIFPKVHVLVFVFASMLIGIVSDYAIHALATGPATNWTDLQTRTGMVIRPITVSMVTSVLSFGLLAIFGVSLFQQVAVFSAAGILSAWAFMMAVLLPLDRRPRDFETKAKAWRSLASWRDRIRIPGSVSLALCVCVALAAIWGALRVKTLDDVRVFQPPSLELKRDEAVLRENGFVLAPARFLLSWGGNADQARRSEEEALETAPEQISALALSRFDPSTERRRQNRSALQQKLYNPLLPQHLAAIGLSGPLGGATLDLDVQAPPWLKTLEGRAGNQTFLVAPIMRLDGPHFDSARAFKIVDPVVNYSDAFAKYRARAFLAALYGMGVAVVATLIIYRRLSALSIAVVPLLAIAASLLIQSALGFPLTFFSFAGALVLLGVGLDYAAFEFEAESENDGWTSLAVSLDAATTLLSMGLLALSRATPLQSFGLTVSIGVVAALCFSCIPRMVGRQFGKASV